MYGMDAFTNPTTTAMVQINCGKCGIAFGDGAQT